MEENLIDYTMDLSSIINNQVTLNDTLIRLEVNLSYINAVLFNLFIVSLAITILFCIYSVIKKFI